MRLRAVRQTYEGLRPFGETPVERTRFHLQRLKECWDGVIEFQQAVGLEAAPFSPQELFEQIFVIGAFAEKELNNADNTLLDCGGSWRTYEAQLQLLSHDVNPFAFCEICTQCRRALQELIGVRRPEQELISFASTVNHAPTGLRLQRS